MEKNSKFNMVNAADRTKPITEVKGDLVFQVISWSFGHVSAKELDAEEEGFLDKQRYIIKAFGCQPDGTTVSVSIKHFEPYFFIKLENGLENDHRIEEKLKNFLTAFKAYVKKVTIVKRKDFWGFTNETQYKFAKLSFASKTAMQNAIQIFKKPQVIRDIGQQPIKFKCYEYNIEPYIRFIHGANIEPSEWIMLPKSTYQSTDILPTNSQIDVEVDYKQVTKYNSDSCAPFVIASFDLECMSLTGDFPMPKKSYKKLASDLYELYFRAIQKMNAAEKTYHIQQAILYALGLIDEFQFSSYIHKVDPKEKIQNKDSLEKLIKMNADAFFQIFIKQYNNEVSNREEIIKTLIEKFELLKLPLLKGDQIIQIGTTYHKYGESKCFLKHICTLGSCDPIEDAIVESFENEKDMILRWRDIIILTNPDIMTGYNIFGFDFWYLYERSKELGIDKEFLKIGRYKGKECHYEEKTLSSSALGDNLLKYIDMDGRVLVDLMKVVQRDHKLDSYKLDNVASHFIGMKKDDISPQDIFRLQKGDSRDRNTIARYCLQDCSLCNHLVMKLEIVANNMGMSNVCLVPLSFIFMRGQGIKIFSLILKQCRDAGFLIPVLNVDKDEENIDDEGYEGAIVLEPKEGIYIDNPVSVLDYASLYPSSMISENLSHDCIVLDKKFDNLPGVEYLDISYDIYEGTGDKKQKVGEKVSRYVQPPNGKKGVIPNILMKLLQARKSTRKKMTMKKVIMKNGDHIEGFLNDTQTQIIVNNVVNKLDPNEIESVTDLYNEFQKAVLDGLQNAYKITANSLYGQMGARTSQVYMKDIAACTTATGRKMILMAKEFLEKQFNANIVYGDTDSIFCIFPIDNSLKGKDKIKPSIEMGIEASKQFKGFLKPPHDLEYEKTFWPFILLSKKRYVGNLYEFDDEHYKQKSMGIVLKRRDNAPIVKHIYGGIIEIILQKHNVTESVEFLKSALQDLIDGKFGLEQLIITKSLRADYKDPGRIAHKVLADRIGDRDPGNMPQVNDRIPYAYIVPSNKKCLQGERIEHPDYIRKNNLKIDYNFYITNQIMKPVLQVYGIVAHQLEGNKKTEAFYNNLFDEEKKKYDEKTAKENIIELRENDAKDILFEPILRKLTNANNNQREITSFFKVSKPGDSPQIRPSFLDTLDKKMFKPGDEIDIIKFNKVEEPKKVKTLKANEKKTNEDMKEKKTVRKKKTIVV